MYVHPPPPCMFLISPQVQADGVTINALTIATWDHLPAPAFSWAGEFGTWRQTFFNRVHEASFAPLSAPPVSLTSPSSSPSASPSSSPSVSPSSSPSASPSLSPPEHKGTPFAQPLSIVSGSGAFYDFNLDFGCCFGHVIPGPSVPVGPDMASSDEILLQRPHYRSLLVNGSRGNGVRFYPLNMEQDFGEVSEWVNEWVNE